MSEFIVNGDNEAALRALSTPHPEWQEVAESHKAIEEKLDQLYSLPIEEFRKIPYRAAPLGTGAPEPGRDLKITESKVAVRDGTNVGIRIYQPLSEEKGRLLYFNIHGGGESLRILAFTNAHLTPHFRVDHRGTRVRGRLEQSSRGSK